MPSSTSSRPYRAEPITRLEQLAKSTDKTVLANVVNELRYRSTYRARRLLRRLAPDQTHDKKGARAGAHEGTRHAAPRVTEAETKYLALRSLFTAQSEALARWGITSLMPQDMQDAALAQWRSALTDNADAHPMGLRLADLDEDIKKLNGWRRDG
jgi:hypothetical protein